MKHFRALVIATSRKTRGGITSVIKAHETGEQWKKFRCHWVQTHRDGSIMVKLSYFIFGLADYVIRLPFYDIVHLHVSQPVTIKRKMIFLRLAKLLNKKVITHFHAFNIDDTIKGNSCKSYSEFFSMSDRIIVLSKWWKSQLIDLMKMPHDKISVLYNPCPSIPGKSVDKKNIILYAGAVNRRKGFEDLLRAFATIASKYPEWKVVFAGNGEIEKGKQLAKRLDIDSQIEFVGWLTGNDKDNLFRMASIFCLPSYAEGFPMSVLDAWAYGLPVITTPVGGIPDIAEDGTNMLLFNPGDINKLSENIERLITESNLRDKIVKASVKFAKGQFNVLTINEELARIYESVINGQPSIR